MNTARLDFEVNRDQHKHPLLTIWQYAANAQAVRSMPVTFKLRHQHLTQRYQTFECHSSGAICSSSERQYSPESAQDLKAHLLKS